MQTIFLSSQGEFGNQGGSGFGNVGGGYGNAGMAQPAFQFYFL